MENTWGYTDTPSCRNACLHEALQQREALGRAGPEPNMVQGRHVSRDILK